MDFFFRLQKKIKKNLRGSRDFGATNSAQCAGGLTPKPPRHNHEREVHAERGRATRTACGYRPRPTSPPPIQKMASWGSSGQIPHHLYRTWPRGERMSSYAWLGVVLAVWAGRVDHPASPPTSQHGTLGDFWLMATMATMATLVADLLKKNLHLENSVGCLLPPASQPSLFFFSISI